MSRLVLAAGLVSLCAAPALAQKAPAPAAAAPPAAVGTQGPPLGGPLIPGICLLSQPAIFANTRIAVAATARLKVLSDQAQAEIDTLRKPLETESATLNAPDSKLPAAEKATRMAALATRAQALQAQANQRSREIEATRVKATQRIGQEEQPVVAEVYKAHKCGLLFDRGTVLGGNMGLDLTPEVIRGLDARITTISFDREILPAQ